MKIKSLLAVTRKGFFPIIYDDFNVKKQSAYQRNGVIEREKGS